MLISRVHFNDQVFVLTAGQDIPALKARIVAALRPGGGFVDFTSVSRGLISVLVTPHLPIRFETIQHEDHQDQEGEMLPGVGGSLAFDIDSFSEQFG